VLSGRDERKAGKTLMYIYLYIQCHLGGPGVVLIWGGGCGGGEAGVGRGWGGWDYVYPTILHGKSVSHLLYSVLLTELFGY
jgi:hypothetical protein